MSQVTINPVIGESSQNSLDKLWGDFDFDSIVKSVTEGTFSPDSQSLLNRITGIFLGELKEAFALVGSIAIIIIIGAFVNNLNQSFKKNAISEATGMALFVYIAAITASAFKVAAGYVLSALGDITLSVHSIVPSMYALCVSSGEMATASMTHPVIYLVCSCAGALIRNVITPLILLRAVCLLLCAITNNDSLGEFSQLFAKFHKTLLTFSMSLFAGIMGITSFAATSFDSLAARGVKFAINTAVPVVGGSISEAMSSVAGSSMMLKNAVGLGGVIVIFSMFAVPMLKIWALSLAFRLTAAFTAPVCEKRVTEILRKIGDCIDMLFSSIACMGTVMIIAIASIL